MVGLAIEVTGISLLVLAAFSDKWFPYDCYLEGTTTLVLARKRVLSGGQYLQLKSQNCSYRGNLSHFPSLEWKMDFLDDQAQNWLPSPGKGFTIGSTWSRTERFSKGDLEKG
jgi:hypothetical protein